MPSVTEAIQAIIILKGAINLKYECIDRYFTFEYLWRHWHLQKSIVDDSRCGDLYSLSIA